MSGSSSCSVSGENNGNDRSRGTAAVGGVITVVATADAAVDSADGLAKALLRLASTRSSHKSGVA